MTVGNLVPRSTTALAVPYGGQPRSDTISVRESKSVALADFGGCGQNRLCSQGTAQTSSESAQGAGGDDRTSPCRQCTRLLPTNLVSHKWAQADLELVVQIHSLIRRPSCFASRRCLA